MQYKHFFIHLKVDLVEMYNQHFICKMANLARNKPMLLHISLILDCILRKMSYSVNSAEIDRNKKQMFFIVSPSLNKK